MYIERLIEKKILRKLRLTGGVLIEGARDIGKTKVSQQICKSEITIKENNIEHIQLDNKIVTSGEKPRLIDEWQIYPQTFNIVKHNIDKEEKNNLFILTGSSTPTKWNPLIHTGSGRISRIKMYSLSLQEKKLTTNRISFQNLFKNKITTGENNVELNFYIDEICKGGRPRLINNSVSECIELNRDYVKNIISSINRKNITKPTLEKVLKDLSRNICCGLNISSIAKNTGLSKETVSTYLDFLVESNIIEYIYCWNTHIRSKANLRTSPKINFTDQCFAVAVLNADREKLLNDFNLLGFMFESLVIKQLNIFCSLSDMNLFFYRDSDGLEIDCVIENNDDEWIGIEIKLGSVEGIENGIKNLNKFYNKLTAEKQKHCKSLNIICASKTSFKVDEKINVISLADLYLEQ